jgi:hypothetical protein
MRTHDHDDDVRDVRPKSARPEPTTSEHHVRAAALGRTDVLDPAALLGLQRSVGNAGVESAVTAEHESSPVHDVISSGRGQPLAPDVRGEMEARLGADFGDVRVHTDSGAHDSAKQLSARAYTVGSNVVFQRDAYDPSSQAGKTTLAHELTHVVQQRQGAVDGTAAPGGIRVSDPSDRFEREAAANADRVMAGPAPALAPLGVQRDAVVADPGSSVQREGEDEEETAQGSFEDSAGAAVQREGEEEQEEQS